MSFDVECVLPCDFWPPYYRVVCHGSTVSELFNAAKDGHDNGCLCQLPPVGYHAWILTEKASHSSVTRFETPPSGSRRVDMNEEVSRLNPEARCTAVAWFFDGEDSDGSSSGTLFSTSPTSPSSLATRVGSKGSCSISSPVKISQGIFKSDGNESNLPSCSLTAFRVLCIQVSVLCSP
ncbi:hypothetical protein ARMSODRAFT_1021309 [Armillaria solidipes]|uniref:Uncharacterized protein n=1 Tax=Armillaria solidipes TaxID=1076256 RepID=A0A2H3B6K4_9AGAR|nr:hypothetical protein ARMSODRAFT_1021309 [Armillaria solidipes]